MSGNFSAESAANGIRNFFGNSSAQAKQSIPTRCASRAALSSTAQGGISEDEALARALQASLNDSKPQARSSNSTPTPVRNLQEEEDRQLALAIAESQKDHSKSTRDKDKCSLS